MNELPKEPHVYLKDKMSEPSGWLFSFFRWPCTVLLPIPLLILLRDGVFHAKTFDDLGFWITISGYLFFAGAVYFAFPLIAIVLHLLILSLFR